MCLNYSWKRHLNCEEYHSKYEMGELCPQASLGSRSMCTLRHHWNSKFQVLGEFLGRVSKFFFASVHVSATKGILHRWLRRRGPWWGTLVWTIIVRFIAGKSNSLTIRSMVCMPGTQVAIGLLLKQPRMRDTSIGLPAGGCYCNFFRY